ncbi:MAG: D-2-hydroxyacid dehydrogenase, partial [Patescibacteria group bacterium]|nr:D-2-hydroxyacid dehydrogenase [Patescibacteria group bacterium]
ARASDADVLLTNKTVLGRQHFERLPKLRYVGVLATGYDVVDVAAARERSVVVTNIPAYGTPSVAQMVFAHLLNLTQHVAEHATTVRDGRWSRSPDFCYWDFPLIELDGLTMGIVGLGQIGRAVARLAVAFGMRVLAYDATTPAQLPEGVWMTSELSRIFRDADVVTLHCPLTPETRQLVSAERLALMKPTALLINTSRGPLVDEAALAEALRTGRLAGAGLDVLSTEPPPADHPLMIAPHCYITPHIAWATQSARRRLLETAVENIRAFLAGEPRNVV